MATEKSETESYGKEAQPGYNGSSGSTASYGCSKVDVILRVLLFASTLVAILVLVTSKQTVRGLFPIPMTAKFQHSPAFIYFLVALSVAGFYSLITILASILVILKPRCSTKSLLLFVLFDVLVLGLVASATGTAGGVAYVGLKGNEHVRWGKICSAFDQFCRKIGISLAFSLFASVLLVLLVFINVSSLHKRIPK